MVHPTTRHGRRSVVLARAPAALPALTGCAPNSAPAPDEAAAPAPAPPPEDVVTVDLIDEVFGLRALVVPDPVTGTPTVVPLDPRTAIPGGPR